MRGKTCSKCKNVYLEKEFNWKKKGEKRSSHCKKCSRLYVKKHYDKNRGYYLDKAKARNEKIRNDARKYLYSHLLKHPCVDCGEGNILVLEFDHIDRDSKFVEVSRIIRLTGSIKKLVEEINKCDVRCANCHRIKTAKESHSWKLNMRL